MSFESVAERYKFLCIKPKPYKISITTEYSNNMSQVSNTNYFNFFVWFSFKMFD